MRKHFRYLFDNLVFYVENVFEMYFWRIMLQEISILKKDYCQLT